MTSDPKDSADENSVACPTCGKKTKVDEKKAERDGYVLCPEGHKVELMRGLL